MARGPVMPGTLGTKEQQLAARAAAIVIITKLLETGPKTSAELLPHLRCFRPTLASYLRHMHQTLRVIRMTGEYRNRGELWALGADSALPSKDDELDRIIAVKRGIGPAKQLGMWRDPMVAALFGPAQGVRA